MYICIACSPESLKCPSSVTMYPLHSFAGHIDEMRSFMPSFMTLIGLPLCVCVCHVEYAERSIEYDILFLFIPVYKYINLEYEHVSV